jgi:hypothetical protein
MKKKIIFGSIIIIVLLINISFYSVVGYRQNESKPKKSPLFTIRSRKMTESMNKKLNCTYLGKGDDKNILFPVRNTELSVIYRAIQKMNQLDDKTIRKKIQHMNLFNNNMNLICVESIISNLFQNIKNHKDLLFNLFNEVDNQYIKPFTIYRPLYLLILVIFILTFGLWMPFISFYMGVTCDPCCFLYEPKTLQI